MKQRIDCLSSTGTVVMWQTLTFHDMCISVDGGRCVREINFITLLYSLTTHAQTFPGLVSTCPLLRLYLRACLVN